MLSFSDTKSNKPTLVLLHGYCENKSIWDSFIASLSEVSRVITIDLPGFGESDLLKETSIENFAGEINRLLTSLNIERSTVIGHSLGGYVSLAYAELFSDQINGLGLFHSTAFADSDEKKDGRNKTIEFIKRNGVAPFASSFVQTLFHPDNQAQMPDKVAKLTEMAANTNADTVIQTAIAMRDRKDRVSVLEKTQVPVLFIVGKNDQAVSLEASLRQCSIPSHSIVQFLENTGHMGMYERPEETIHSIKSFFTLCNP